MYASVYVCLLQLYMYNPFPLVYVFIGHYECLLYNLPVAPQLVIK